MDSMGIVATSNAIASTRLATDVGTAVLKRALDTVADATTALLATLPRTAQTGIGSQLDLRL